MSPTSASHGHPGRQSGERPGPVTVAVLNQKGGVGKTTITLGLASAARAAGDRVLVVDADPQASATWSLGAPTDDPDADLGRVLDANRDGAAEAAIRPSAWGPLVDVLPAGPTLAAREHDHARRRPEQRLRRALQGITGHRFVLVDCPPSLGLTTVTALTAADLVLIVVEPGAYANRGVAAVLDLVDEVWDRHNRDLDIGGVVVNRMPARSLEADARVDELGTIVGRRAVWRPPVPQRVIVNEALGEGRPVHDYRSRARDVIDAFDRLYDRLRRTAS